MSGLTSIAWQKQALRRDLKQRRAAIPIPEKTAADAQILTGILRSPAYQKAELLLAYASTPQEISTRALIAQAFADGKRVALPYCVPGTQHMEFYEVTNPLTLRRSAFGIDEPVPREETRIDSTAGAVCVVPALSVDDNGHRLGYGGGFYDRFLAQHPALFTIGLCYERCRVPELPVDPYDICVLQIITELTMEVYNAG